MANQGLWKVVTHEEAVREVRDITDPVVAAKRLQDLAQGYGSRENIAVVVVRLMLSEAERLRVQDALSTQRASQRELLRVLSRRSDLLELRDGVPPTPELSDVVIDRAGRAKKASRSSSGGSNPQLKSKPSPSPEPAHQPQRPRLKDGSPRERKGRTGSQHGSSKLYRKKDDGAPSTWESVLSKRLAEEVKSKELKHAFLANDGDEEEEEKEAEKNVIDFSSETPNWRAETKRRRGEGLEEWSQAMQERLAREVKQREIQRELAGKEGREVVLVVEGEVHRDGDGQGSNWSTLNKKKALADGGGADEGGAATSRKLTTPARNGVPYDPDSNAPDVVRSAHDAGNSKHRTPPPPPPPRPPAATKPKPPPTATSSRPYRPPPPPPPPPPPAPPPPSAPAPLLWNVAPAALRDSLVSLDDFKKDVVRSSDIDRDAILFHQMQMARVQSGSNASLTSIQSDPLYASVREVFSPNLPASSRSIEVLVHSHQRFAEDADDLADSTRVLFADDDDHYAYCDEDDDDIDGDNISRDSDNTVMDVEVAESFDVTVEALYDHIRDRRLRMAADSDSSKINMWNGESAERDADSDTDTLVGEGEQQGEEEEEEEEEESARHQHDVEEELYATVNKNRKRQTADAGSAALANGVDHPAESDLCNRESPTYLTPYVPSSLKPPPPPSPPPLAPPPPPPPPPPPLPPPPSSFKPVVTSSKLSNQRSIIITYL